jgi:ribosome-associated protein
VIEITDSIRLDEGELSERFIRAPGPGGQNVNKVSTAVQLQFDVARSPSLPEDTRRRLIALGGRRVSSEGILTITAHRHRTRERNRQDALDRLVDLIRRASYRPPPRKATRPTRGSMERRLARKRERASLKRMRGAPGPGD